MRHPQPIEVLTDGYSYCHQCGDGDCGTPSPPVVQLGDTPDWESSTANVCRACLVQAIEALDAHAAGIAKA